MGSVPELMQPILLSRESLPEMNPTLSEKVALSLD